MLHEHTTVVQHTDTEAYSIALDNLPVSVPAAVEPDVQCVERPDPPADKQKASYSEYVYDNIAASCKPLTL